MPTAAVMVMRPPWLSGVMMVLGGVEVWDMAFIGALGFGLRAAKCGKARWVGVEGRESRERDQEGAEDDGLDT